MHVLTIDPKRKNGEIITRLDDDTDEGIDRLFREAKGKPGTVILWNASKLTDIVGLCVQRNGEERVPATEATKRDLMRCKKVITEVVRAERKRIKEEKKEKFEAEVAEQAAEFASVLA